MLIDSLGVSGTTAEGKRTLEDRECKLKKNLLYESVNDQKDLLRCNLHLSH